MADMTSQEKVCAALLKHLGITKEEMMEISIKYGARIRVPSLTEATKQYKVIIKKGLK